MEFILNLNPVIIAAVITAFATILASIISKTKAGNKNKIKNSNIVSMEKDIKTINQTNKGDNNTFIGIQYNGKEE